ncbi:CPBP family intramembrane glutamic endopeptidase [Leucobacter japonicus]|uniref:CPBP family intramembrane glutamic endopeptidase n=1 Tax=Leucobacter japonicus TaxID=1461259 RepID=UPI0009498A06|nr:type II CAAX endopeptidase family protein [Leucobacter japonicus]
MHEAEHALTATPSAWRRFWERGDWWRAIVLAAAYYAVYQLLSLVVVQIFPAGGALRGAAGSPADVLIDTALPIVLGSIVLVAFAGSLGWLRELFGTQRLRGRGWMWIGIGVVLVINASALGAVDYASAGGVLIATWLLTGLFIGFAEELLTRGFVVTLMRKAGHGEIAVALVSAAVFAALHAGNFFTTDQGLATTALQVVYTFAFGIIMYLALRLTGRLIWPILLHASTDPTLFLFGAHPAQGNPLALLPAVSTYLVIATGLVLLVVFIVSERRRAKQTPRFDLPTSAR